MNHDSTFFFLRKKEKLTIKILLLNIESTSPLNNKKRHHSSTSLNISYSDEVDGDSSCCFQVNMETKTRVGDDLQQVKCFPSYFEIFYNELQQITHENCQTF